MVYMLPRYRSAASNAIADDILQFLNESLKYYCIFALQNTREEMMKKLYTAMTSNEPLYMTVQPDKEATFQNTIFQMGKFNTMKSQFQFLFRIENGSEKGANGDEGDARTGRLASIVEPTTLAPPPPMKLKASPSSKRDAKSGPRGNKFGDSTARHAVSARKKSSEKRTSLVDKRRKNAEEGKIDIYEITWQFDARDTLSVDSNGIVPPKPTHKGTISFSNEFIGNKAYMSQVFEKIRSVLQDIQPFSGEDAYYIINQGRRTNAILKFTTVRGTSFRIRTNKISKYVHELQLNSDVKSNLTSYVSKIVDSLSVEGQEISDRLTTEIEKLKQLLVKERADKARAVQELKLVNAQYLSELQRSREKIAAAIPEEPEPKRKLARARP